MEQNVTTETIHLLVILEHSQVQIFRSTYKGAVLESIAPYGTRRSPEHVHSAQDHGKRQSRPVSPSYYTAIADGLEGADEILMVASGDGGKKTIDALMAELEASHKDLFTKVVGTVVVEGKYISEEALLEKAQEFHNGRGA